jgi:predicted phosphate transport protein (TIGR00153 family)
MTRWANYPIPQAEIRIPQSVDNGGGGGLYFGSRFNSNTSPAGRNPFMARFSLIPREEQYFALFRQMTSHIYDAASQLAEMLADKQENFIDHLRKIKAIEHTCDELTHSISTKLNSSFITPFDREDIYLLSGALDDIVDLIDDAARALVMYNVRETTDFARQFGDVLQRMAVQLHEVVSTLERPAGIAPRLVEIHRLENEGDDLYHEAIGELFRGTPDPLRVIRWKDVYDKLEAAVDRCEQAANIIESVIIKHA